MHMHRLQPNNLYELCRVRTISVPAMQAKEDDVQLHGCVAALASFLDEHDLRTGVLTGELV